MHGFSGHLFGAFIPRLPQNGEEDDYCPESLAAHGGDLRRCRDRSPLFADFFPLTGKAMAFRNGIRPFAGMGLGITRS